MDVPEKANRLEAVIREMTQPINDQYPRPWMTSLVDPDSARVFTVGMNQRKCFKVGDVGSHERYMHALFNRDPGACRKLYDRLTGAPSRTRLNTDKLVSKLSEQGVADVIETNVICCSTPMSADLRRSAHVGGTQKGRELFRALLDIIRPKVIVAHGAGTAKALSRLLGTSVPTPPKKESEPIAVSLVGMRVFVIPSLAPPQFNKWSRWSDEHLDGVARAVARHLQST